MKKTSIILFVVTIFILIFIGIVNLKKSNSHIEDKQSLSLPGNLESKANIRKAAAAGTFYPSEKEKLINEIDNYLNHATRYELSDNIRILLVPHAGIKYSGQIAAYGFKQLQGKKISRVILLGSSHTTSFDYLAVDDNKFWETPLGKVEVDSDYVQTIVNGKSIKADKLPHLKEHSLEIELLFLQRVLSDFKIVPILTGKLDAGHISLLAQKLAYNFDDRTLLVVSSDLSHYPNWETSNIVDSEVIDSILTGIKENFDQKLSDLKARDYKGLETAACAQDAIKVSLEMSEFLGISKFEKLKYGNSGDVTGEKDRVVGYTSILGHSGKLNSYSPKLDHLAKKELSEIARKTLEVYLSTKAISDIKPQSEYLNQPQGAFVTLIKNETLRGCIGEFEPVRPLYKVIQDTVISSAIKDSRFTPVTLDELKDINIEISVMTPKRKIDNWQNIRLGKDGVVIQKGVNAGK